jgi:hypothetical protein
MHVSAAGAEDIFHISHPYKTTGNIIYIPYILIFIFWLADWKTTDSAPNNKPSLTSICS